MSTILVPTNEKTCTSYKLDNDASSVKQADNNLDLIVTFLNFPQATNDMSENHNNLLEEERPMPHLVPLQRTTSSNATLALESTVHQITETPISEHTNELLSNDADPPTITILETSIYPPLPDTDINTTHNIENATELSANNDEVEIEYEMEESDEEEEELTNLTWLTELRNQSITWPGSINPTILDDNSEARAGGASENVIVLECMDGSASDEKLSSGNNKNILKMGAKTSLVNMSNLSVHTKDNQRQLNGCNNAKPGTAQAQVKRPTPAERYQIFMDKVKRDLQEYEQSAINYQTDTTEKPPFNYSHIIGMAMLEKGRVTLQQICAWIEAKFAFFRVRKKWNNSIRHNLSLHHCFRKINRNKYEKGKGGYWELGVDPKKCDRKRIRNRKSANSQRNKKANQTQNSQNSNSSYADLNEAASAVAGLIETTTTSHNLSDDIDMELDAQLNDGLEQAEQLLLDDLDVQQNIDISSNQQQQQHQQQLQSNLERQLLQEEAFIANVLANCIEMDAAAHNVAEATSSSQELQAAMAASVTHMPQYQLGTVIISASSDDMVGTLNSFIYNHGGHENNNSSHGNSEYCQTQQHKILYREDEIPPASENVIVSSFLDPHSNVTNPNRPNVIVEPIEPYYSVISASATTLVSTNGDCTSAAGEHFRPYIDGIDEAFQYLRSMDHNRSEDLLDNLLDISVSDY